MINAVIKYFLDFVIALVIACTALEVLTNPALWPLAVALIFVVGIDLSAWRLDLYSAYNLLVRNKRKSRRNAFTATKPKARAGI